MTVRRRARAARAAALAGALLLLLAAAVGATDPAASPGARPGPTPIAPATLAPAPEIEGLMADDGTPFSIAGLRGAPAILFFGYTHCPDVCPATLGELFGVIAARPDVHVVFITLDPERDTPRFISEWTATLPEAFTAVTGTPLAIRAAADRYGVRYARVDTTSTEGYTIAHTAEQHLIDADGNLRRTWVFGTPPAAIVADLAEVAPPAAAELHVEGAWARASAMMDRAGAAYLVVRNGGSADDALVGVATPAAMHAELHETTTDAAGMMGMVAVDAVPVPAGGMAVLEPGGYHVMLMGLTGPLVAGTTIPLTLTFASGAVVEVDAEVRESGPMAPTGSHAPGHAG
ncbi:MAG: copper chaperone PCu(A)C [Chloroflexota bacterium]